MKSFDLINTHLLKYVLTAKHSSLLFVLGVLAAITASMLAAKS